MSSETQQTTELLAGMLNKSVYVMYRTFSNLELVKKHLHEHLEWMVLQEKSGRIFAAGPFLDGKGEIGSGSMIILRANSIEEAAAIGEDDPLVRHQLVTYDLREWRIMEGRVSVRVDFSDQTYRID